MSDIMSIIEEALSSIEQEVDSLPHVNASKIGLDVRAGMVWVDTEAELIIASGSNIRSLEYYGGFEYVDGEYTTEIGRFKIYSAEHDRVRDAIDHYEESKDSDDE